MGRNHPSLRHLGCQRAWHSAKYFQYQHTCKQRQWYDAAHVCLYACMRSTYFPLMHCCLYNYAHVYSNVDMQLTSRKGYFTSLDAWAHTLMTQVELNTRLYQQKPNRATIDCVHFTLLKLKRPENESDVYMYDMVLCSKSVCVHA